MCAKIEARKGIVGFSSKSIAITAVTVALLIGGQFVLSFFAGVEIVTLLLAVFCVTFGVLHGLVASVAFALLRCFVFGFSPSVIILYLIYYPLFSLAVGFYGKLLNKVFDGSENHKSGLFHTKIARFLVFNVGLVILVCFLTCTFTMLDNLITPWIMGFGRNSKMIYFYNSLPTLLSHVICVGVTVLVLFFPTYKIMEKVKHGMRL